MPDINSMAQCSTAGGSCKLQLEDGVLKCKTHNDNEEIVGKLYATSAGENFGTINTTYNANSGLREPALLSDSSNADKSSYNNIGLTLDEMKSNYRNMAISVAKYKGFYVGRYETSLTDSNEKSPGTSGSVQSKQGVIPTAADNIKTSTWYGLYKSQDKTYTGTNNSVESSMIWGSQYDAMLNWIKNGLDENKIKDDSLGNHDGNVTITGNEIYKEDKINNIRDLDGNLRELTLETYDSYGRAHRGGGYDIVKTASYRSYCYPSYNQGVHGSRMTLYIK